MNEGDPHAGDRWVWSAQSHRLFQEACAFYLIRFDRIEITDVTSDVLSMAARAEIRSASAYTTYGNFDALLRVWQTNQKRQRLRRTLEASPSVTDIIEVPVQDVDYLWARHNAKKVAGELLQQIAEAQQSIQDGAPRRDLLEKLEKLGAVHRAPPFKDGQIKLYILLTLGKGQQRPADAKDRLKRALLEASIAPSIYETENASQFDFMVQALVADYYKIPDLISAVESEMPSHHTQTLLFSAPGHDEDNIDFSYQELTPKLWELEEHLGPSSTKYLLNLSELDRVEVGQIFDEFRDIFHNPRTKFFEGYLRARIERSDLMLNEKLAFINHIEELLRSYLMRRLGGTLGADWYPQIRNDKGGVEEPSRWSFMDLVKVIGIARERQTIPTHEEQLLFKKQTMRDLGELRLLRNMLAHGELFDPGKSRAFWTDWYRHSLIVGRMARLYVNLLEISESESSSPNNGQRG